MRKGLSKKAFKIFTAQNEGSSKSLRKKRKREKNDKENSNENQIENQNEDQNEDQNENQNENLNENQNENLNENNPNEDIPDEDILDDEKPLEIEDTDFFERFRVEGCPNWYLLPTSFTFKRINNNWLTDVDPDSTWIYYKEDFNCTDLQEKEEIALNKGFNVPLATDKENSHDIIKCLREDKTAFLAIPIRKHVENQLVTKSRNQKPGKMLEIIQLKWINNEDGQPPKKKRKILKKPLEKRPENFPWNTSEDPQIESGQFQPRTCKYKFFETESFTYNI